MNAPLSHRLESIATSLGAAVILFAGSSPAPAQSILSIHDQATGTTRVFSPGNATFSVSGDGHAVDIDVADPGTSWYLRFEAPIGETLAPGRYDDAGCRVPLRMGRAPGMEVTDNNPACSVGLGMDTLWGSFVIRQIAYDAAGKVASLEAMFTQRKGSPTAPALGGLIRYEARPVSLALHSDPGFVWGAIAQESHGDTGLFTLEGTVIDGLDYTASVRKDIWRVLIVPPTGRPLRIGSYSTKAAAENHRAGLLVLRGFDQPARCPEASGRLDIQKMRANAVGVIQSLQASFTYRCGGARPALHGTIRFKE